MKKIVLWAGLFLVFLAGLILLKPQLLLGPNMTVRSGSITLSALQGEVTVRYNEYAVPSISAENEHDLFYATGYIMASERLFQMDMVNRAVQGRLSEIDAELVGSDSYLRTWGFLRLGEAMLQIMDETAQDILQWTCNGINAYVDEHSDDLPIEFKVVGHEPLPWTPAVMAAYGRMMAHEFKTAYNAEVVRSLVMDKLGPEYADDLMLGGSSSMSSAADQEALEAMRNFFALGQRALDPVAGAPGLGGSNNWVISGSRTATGYPLLGNDPHMGYTQPAKFMELHLKGGRFNVRGVYLAGLPLAILGNNANIAWGMTVVTVDDIDYFVEQVNPENGAEYLYKGEWLPFATREEVIAVKGGAAATVTVRETVHGVIINDLHPLLKGSASPVAMRWTGQDNVDILDAMIRINLAHDWQSFSEGVRRFNTPGQNLVYADRQGNIGWRPAAHVPIRKDADKILLRPGASGEYDWQGYIPFEEMPYLYNPPEGYIATANHNTLDTEYPYYISRYWAGPYRYNRIKELLEATDKHTLESMAAIQNDNHSDFAAQLLPHLLAAFESSDPANEQQAEAVQILRQWDFEMSADAVAPTLFNGWFMALTDAIYRDEMESVGSGLQRGYLQSPGIVRQNLLRLVRSGDSPWFDNTVTPEKEDLGTIVRQALAAAISDLTMRLGLDMSDWHWGDLHSITYVHDLSKDKKYGKFLNWWLNLNIGPYGISGSPTTANAQAYKLYNPYVVTNGPSYRALFDLADLDRSKIIIPTGQSGNSMDWHYRDQVELYNSGRYRPVAFSDEAVAAATISTLVLKP